MSENDPSGVEPPLDATPDEAGEEAELPPKIVQHHYRRAAPALKAIATVDGHPTIGVNDYRGWYTTREQDDLELRQAGFDQQRRVTTLDRDLETLLDRVERCIYATTAYKKEAATRTERACTYDPDKETIIWKDDEKPLPGYADLRAVPAWGDIDLRDELKPERGTFDIETRETIEVTLEAYIDEFAALYGDRDAVYALDSVGGAYIFGAPEVTLPIAEYFVDDRGARARVMEAFVTRSNEWLADAQERVEERVDGANDVIAPDWVNNKNRQYKAPLSLHTDHDAVVTPLDVTDEGGLEYDYTPLEAVDDDLIADAEAWGKRFTADEHRDRVERLVAKLWPEYVETAADWREALEAFVADEREQEQKRQDRRRKAKQRRTERRADLDGALEEYSITPFMQDVYDALDEIDTADVVRNHACKEWDTGRSTPNVTEFNPIWRPSDSGSSCYVDHSANTFGDPGDGGGGYAAKAMALGMGILEAADEDLNGEDWRTAVDALRNAGYDVPVYIPEKGSQRPDDGTYDEMPLWALRKAAVVLDVCPSEAFVERETDDNDMYLGFPDAETYNSALEAISEAGLEYGREPVDSGPRHPVYDVVDDANVELHLIPENGRDVRIEVRQNGRVAYTETKERGFWNNRTVRARVAGAAADVLTGVDQKAVKSGVKSALTQASAEAGTDEFDEAMRSPLERELRDRTIDIVCYPGADTTEWHVTLEPPKEGRVTDSAEFVFSEGDFSDYNAGTFKNAHWREFHQRCEPDGEEWANLADYWAAEAKIREREPDHRRDAAAETFLEWVNGITVWIDEDGFNWRQEHGLYVEDFDDGRDAVLVPGARATDWTDRQSKDFDDPGWLSRTLRNEDVLLGTSFRTTIAGTRRKVWPVNAERTEWDADTARSADLDDDETPEGLK